MHGIDELKRQYDEAVSASRDASVREGERLRALKSAVSAKAMAELEARGIVPGARVTHGGYSGIFVFVEARDYSPTKPRLVIMAEKKDGTAHARSEARGFWDAKISDISPAARKGGDA